MPARSPAALQTIVDAELLGLGAMLRTTFARSARRRPCPSSAMLVARFAQLNPIHSPGGHGGRRRARPRPRPPAPSSRAPAPARACVLDHIRARRAAGRCTVLRAAKVLADQQHHYEACLALSPACAPPGTVRRFLISTTEVIPTRRFSEPMAGGVERDRTEACTIYLTLHAADRAPAGRADCGRPGQRQTAVRKRRGAASSSARADDSRPPPPCLLRARTRYRSPTRLRPASSGGALLARPCFVGRAVRAV